MHLEKNTSIEAFWLGLICLKWFKFIDTKNFLACQASCLRGLMDKSLDFHTEGPRFEPNANQKKL